MKVKKKSLILFTNLLIPFVMMFLMIPVFETNDDIVMAEMVNGSRATSSPFLIFENYVLGLIYKGLYSLKPDFPWYTILQLALVALAFTALGWILFERMETGTAIIIMAVILIYFGYECYIPIQFTKTAGILTGVSVLLLLYSVAGEDLCISAMIFGWIFGCFAFMYRYTQVFACIALMSGIGVYLLLETIGSLDWFLERIRRCLLVFGVLAVLFAGLYGVNYYVYHTDEEWAQFREYNDVRSEIYDYGFPSYEDNKEKYEELGLTQDAVELYVAGNFYDPDVFTVDVMKELAALRPKTEFSKELVIKYIKYIPLLFFQSHIFYAFLILAVLWLLFGEHKPTMIVTAVYEILIFAVLYFYLYYKGRFFLNRVDTGLWFCMSLVVLWFIRDFKYKNWKITTAAILVLLLLNQSTWLNYWRYTSKDIYRDRRGRDRGIVEEVASDQDHFYVIKCSCFSSSTAYGPMDAMPQKVFANICWLGGWDCNVLDSLRTNEKYGVRNPYKDMIDNEQIYLMDDNIDWTLRYLRHYYGENIVAEQVKVIVDMPVYRIKTEAPTEAPTETPKEAEAAEQKNKESEEQKKRES